MIEFLQPISAEILTVVNKLSPHQLGARLVLHTEKNFPNLEQLKLVIIGVPENRPNNHDIATVNLTPVRAELYSLFSGNWLEIIGDLGDILPGNTINDTYFVLRKVCENLIKRQIIPIVIGGSQDLTYPMYRAYDALEQMVNLVAIDSKFDFGKENDAISARSYLTKIIVDEPTNLFNFSNVAYQSYFNPQEEIDLIEKLYFDAYRLGEVSNNLSIAEPVFRAADLVSIDLNSVQSLSSGNLIDFSPNGFDGKEICSLSRYAGISDKVTAIGIFNFNNTVPESHLIAQIIWYFIEGYHYRSNEYPFSSKENYLKYIVPLDDDNEQVVFFKSNKTERWWIEIKNSLKNNTNKTSLLPCTHDDYLAACNHEIPERWWKAQRKSII